MDWVCPAVELCSVVDFFLFICSHARFPGCILYFMLISDCYVLNVVVKLTCFSGQLKLAGCPCPDAKSLEWCDAVPKTNQ